jgi:hypothetical protein
MNEPDSILTNFMPMEFVCSCPMAVDWDSVISRQIERGREKILIIG